MSLFNTQEKKNFERKKKIRLDVYRYEDASEKHQKVIHSDKIERAIESLPEEEDNNDSSGEV